MKTELYQNELTYQLVMNQAHQLLEGELITQQEYEQFQKTILQKCQPFISRLVG
ncbi:SHOCT domain-containing protein [Streptococcus sp. ZJ93]|uniref:SHOCT domain-containing protein n=1 Tax=Streptococcus handemini TaxID=3161188 RepID=UPI0032ED9B79